MRIYVDSLGCKLNQAEMEELAVAFTQRGHELVTLPAEADVCVLNTCAVTHVAAQKSRQALRRLHRENPTARLVATGCYAELAPDALRKLPGVVHVVGNEAKAEIAGLFAPAAIKSEVEAWPPLPRTRTRALVKVQDGCDNACTYCIIHVARGPQRSRPAGRVLSEIRARVAAGYREVVLTGVHVGAYGRDRGMAGALDLWDLVARILGETGVERVRLSSIEPWDLPQRALALWQDARLCRHLHLPLQSGSDTVLSRMARRYTTAEFEELVEAARAAIPGLAVTTDVIVGFPGETEKESADSLDFVSRMGFARVHAFPYSQRPDTPAAALPGHVPAEVKAERSRTMRVVAARTAAAFRARFVGATLPVLWESSRETGAGRQWSGLTDNYLRVYAIREADLQNRITPVRLTALIQRGLQGTISGS